MARTLLWARNMLPLTVLVGLGAEDQMSKELSLWNSWHRGSWDPLRWSRWSIWRRCWSWSCPYPSMSISCSTSHGSNQSRSPTWAQRPTTLLQFQSLMEHPPARSEVSWMFTGGNASTVYLLFSSLSPLQEAGDPELQLMKCICYASASMGVFKACVIRVFVLVLNLSCAFDIKPFFVYWQIVWSASGSC